jgi:hypothetical protein
MLETALNVCISTWGQKHCLEKRLIVSEFVTQRPICTEVNWGKRVRSKYPLVTAGPSLTCTSLMLLIPPCISLKWAPPTCDTEVSLLALVQAKKKKKKLQTSVLIWSGCWRVIKILLTSVSQRLKKMVLASWLLRTNCQVDSACVTSGFWCQKGVNL